MKTYLKDLTPEEVIRRLKEGKVHKFNVTAEANVIFDAEEIVEDL